MIILCGDLHLRKEDPYFSCQKKLLNYFLSQDWKADDVFIQLGDFFHKSKPEPQVYDLAISFLNNLKCKKIILAGNYAHEYNRLDDSFAIEPLKNCKDTKIIKSITELEIEGLNFALIPNLPDLSKYTNNLYFKDYVETYNFRQDNDFYLGHFSDEDLFTEKGIKINRQGKFILGHIHKTYNNFLGLPMKTNYAEKDNNSVLGFIKNGVFSIEKIPEFLNFIDIDFSNKYDLSGVDKENTIITIKNANKMDAFLDTLKDYNIRDIEYKLEDKQEDMDFKRGDNIDLKLIIDMFLSQSNYPENIKKRFLELCLS